MISPSADTAAAPIVKFEYGAYARERAPVAAPAAVAIKSAS